jgi:hypothetical protein
VSTAAFTFDEKPFQHPPGAQPGHPASGQSSVTDANLEACHENKRTTQDSRKAKGDINLRLYDCPDDASDDLVFSGSVLDDDRGGDCSCTATRLIGHWPRCTHCIAGRPVVNHRILGL